MAALTVWKFDTATGAGEALGKFVVCRSRAAVGGVAETVLPLFGQLRHGHAAEQEGLCMADRRIGGAEVRLVEPGAGYQ